MRTHPNLHRAATAVALVVGVGVASIGVAGAADGQAAPNPERRAARCARVQERIEQVPGIQDRIRHRIARIERRIDAVADPQRRAAIAARLQPRIDRLQHLEQRLGELTATAQQRCASGGV